MQIRAKANGSVIDVPEEQALALLNTGIFEALDADVQIAEEYEDDDDAVPQPKRYKRRDLKAED